MTRTRLRVMVTMVATRNSGVAWNRRHGCIGKAALTNVPKTVGPDSVQSK